MNLFLPLFIIIFPAIVLGQSYGKFINDSLSKIKANDSFIVWDKHRQLTMDDFQGIPDPTNVANAITSYNFRIIYSADSPFKAHAICYFEKKLSWVKKNISNSYTINHEQGHFNIAQLSVKKMNQLLKKIKKMMTVVSSKFRRFTIQGLTMTINCKKNMTTKPIIL